MLNPLERSILADYRSWRKRVPIQQALQQVLATLEATAEQLCRGGDHHSEGAVWQFYDRVNDLIAIVNLRRGPATRYQRFWQTGRLSQPGDHVVLIYSREGIDYLLCVCPDIGCAIKHGRAALLNANIEAFSVFRPDDTLILERVTRFTKVAEVEAQLAGG